MPSRPAPDPATPPRKRLKQSKSDILSPRDKNVPNSPSSSFLGDPKSRWPFLSNSPKSQHFGPSGEDDGHGGEEVEVADRDEIDGGDEEGPCERAGGDAEGMEMDDEDEDELDVARAKGKSKFGVECDEKGIGSDGGKDDGGQEGQSGEIQACDATVGDREGMEVDDEGDAAVARNGKRAVTGRMERERTGIKGGSGGEVDDETGEDEDGVSDVDSEEDEDVYESEDDGGDISDDDDVVVDEASLTAEVPLVGAKLRTLCPHDWTTDGKLKKEYKRRMRGVGIWVTEWMMAAMATCSAVAVTLGFLICLKVKEFIVLESRGTLGIRNGKLVKTEKFASALTDAWLATVEACGRKCQLLDLAVIYLCDRGGSLWQRELTKWYHDQSNRPFPIWTIFSAGKDVRALVGKRVGLYGRSYGTNLYGGQSLQMPARQGEHDRKDAAGEGVNSKVRAHLKSNPSDTAGARTLLDLGYRLHEYPGNVLQALETILLGIARLITFGFNINVYDRAPAAPGPILPEKSDDMIDSTLASLWDKLWDLHLAEVKASQDKRFGREYRLLPLHWRKVKRTLPKPTELFLAPFVKSSRLTSKTLLRSLWTQVPIESGRDATGQSVIEWVSPYPALRQRMAEKHIPLHCFASTLYQGDRLKTMIPCFKVGSSKVRNVGFFGRKGTDGDKGDASYDDETIGMIAKGIATGLFLAEEDERMEVTDEH